MKVQKRIQIVEDEAVVAMELTMLLENFGFEVTGTAVSGDQALHLADERRPDLIVMDIWINGDIDGIETARRIRERHDVPVLFLTAYGDEATLARALDVAPYGYLIKPYRPEELRASIKVVLQKHETETRLRQNERWFSRTLNCLGEGIIATETDGRIRLMNPVAERLTGQTAAQATGRAIEEVFTLLEPDTGRARPNPLRRALDNGESTALETGELPLMHGERRTHVDAAATLIRDQDGGLLGGVLVFRDTTVRKIAEEQSTLYGDYLECMVRERTTELERANAAKASFLSAMSHELRTPMNAVLGFSQLLELEPLPEEPASYARYIHQASEHMVRLIDDLLDLKGIETGQMLVQLQAASLAEALAYAERLVRPLAEQKQVDLQLPDASGATVIADPIRLGQVLVKLMANAINYNRSGGAVEVAVEDADARRLRISVRDTGIGIAPADQARLFRPFERLGTHNVGPAGTGNGLALSKRLVELMGGEIGVESCPGQGSIFWFMLPKPGAMPVH